MLAVHTRNETNNSFSEKVSFIETLITMLQTQIPDIIHFSTLRDYGMQQPNSDQFIFFWFVWIASFWSARHFVEIDVSISSTSYIVSLYSPRLVKGLTLQVPPTETGKERCETMCGLGDSLCLYDV